MSQPDQQISRLLPVPSQCLRLDGTFTLSSRTLQAQFNTLHSDRLTDALKRIGGTTEAASSVEKNVAAMVEFDISRLSPRYPGLDEDESYRLKITPSRIIITAATEVGGLRAVSTLAQLLDDSLVLPCLEIEDAPRLRWRGLLLDPARHFLPLSALLRTLDGMAACKLNVLHLHLSDDQGFRLPSSAFEKLPSEQHYSVEELKILVDYAAERGIRVVPELDMPGHVNCWLAAYPHWGSGSTSSTDRFGVHKACLDPTSEAVYQAIELLLAELADYFPDPCIHIGGDEVHPDWWSSDERIVEFMRQRGLAGIADLQNFFNLRIGKMVEKLGRQVVAWDEVAHEQLPVDWIVQAWRGATSRDRVRVRGNRVLMSAPYYLDLHYSAHSYYQFDPTARQRNLLDLEDALEADPRCAHVAGGMRWTHQWRKDAVDIPEPDANSALLGAEACLWGELVDEQVLDQRLWSRMPALAELFWTQSEQLEPVTLTQRLRSFRQRELVRCGIDLEDELFRAFSRLGIPEDWHGLTELVEPVKWYGRLLGEQALAARLAGAEMPQARPYGTRTDLDKLADVLPPASEMWDRLLLADSGGSETDRESLRETLQRWQQLCLDDHPPAPLRSLVPSLAGLVSASLARLEGDTVDPRKLAQLMVPQGELMLAPSPAFLSWLSEGG